MARVTDESWRPLGVDTDDQVAEYDALHNGVPEWMHASYWAWIRSALTFRWDEWDDADSGPRHTDALDVALYERTCQTLRIATVDLRSAYSDAGTRERQFKQATDALLKHAAPLQIADYLLAQGGRGKAAELDAVLHRSKSAYKVGERAGRPGLVRRVPLGVQVAADAVMARAGRAGVRLAKAWEELYGLTPNASEAYRLAILAVEDAAVPVVSPLNAKATLGTVLRQMEDQANWELPMLREHPDAPSQRVVIGMLRMLWHGQHDRHGGQPLAPGNVTADEAQVAVSLAAALVAWLDAGLIQRGGRTP
jgi:hypothetical protein